MLSDRLSVAIETAIDSITGSSIHGIKTSILGFGIGTNVRLSRLFPSIASGTTATLEQTRLEHKFSVLGLRNDEV